ncbi:hypothetical protein RSL75_004501 [Salmonella enterica]|nr:hypothetical protein [Salmonella enterica]
MDVMSEFRRWKGEQLKPDRPTVGQILMTLFLWLTGALMATVLVLLLLMYG